MAFRGGTLGGGVIGLLKKFNHINYLQMMVSVLKSKNKVLCIYPANNLENLLYVRHFARFIADRDE